MNQQQLIFKRIHKDTAGRPLTIEEFEAQYIGQLMFLYVDTYGVPEETVKEIIGRGGKET